MTDTQQESIEDNQQALVDSASSCLVIAAPVLLDCGRHEEEWLDPIFTSSGYMEHVITCMGMDVSVFDGVRLILDRVVDGSMSLDEPEEASSPRRSPSRRTYPLTKTYPHWGNRLSIPHQLYRPVPFRS